jgi:hypothetical protein
MLYSFSLFSILEVLLVIVPALLSVAYVTVAERKTMASMQRRVGPNKVGVYGLLQAFADALKLILKEYVSPTQANLILFFLGPIITLIFSLLGFSVIPYEPGVAITDMNLVIFFLLAVSFLGGWSANSNLYAFLGFLNSSIIRYSLVSSSAILLVIILTTGNLNITVITSERAIWLAQFMSFYLDLVLLIVDLPVLFALIIVAACILQGFDVLLANFSLLSCPFTTSSSRDNPQAKSIKMTDDEFNQWFTGFTDASKKKALVVWGTNLESTVGSGRFTKLVSNVIKIAPYQYSVIVGLLLSDGWLTFASKTNKSARLGFAQSGDHSKYLWFVFFSLAHYCSSSPTIRNRTRFDKQTIELQFLT